jgi:hypothetical protein
MVHTHICARSLESMTWVLRAAYRKDPANGASDRGIGEASALAYSGGIRILASWERIRCLCRPSVRLLGDG